MTTGKAWDITIRASELQADTEKIGSSYGIYRPFLQQPFPADRYDLLKQSHLIWSDTHVITIKTDDRLRLRYSVSQALASRLA